MQSQQEQLLGLGLTLKPMATVGRSLVALKPFPASREVLHDNPVLRWAGDAPLPERLEHLRVWNSEDGEEVDGENIVPKFLASAALAFISLHDETFAEEQPQLSAQQRQAVVLDMQIPDLPIDHQSTLELFEFSRRLSRFVFRSARSASQQKVLSDFLVDPDVLKDDGANRAIVVDMLLAAGHTELISEVDSPQQQQEIQGAVCCKAQTSLQKYMQSLFLHAMFAAKVNSHRTTSGDWCLFPLGSKFAHSCDPNVMYVLERQAFVAVKDIAVGEHLHFNYAGGRTFLQSTQLRQKGLLASHLFLCRCARCDGPDLARQMICPSCKAAGDDDREESSSAAELGYILRKGSPLQLLDVDVFPAKLWRCSHDSNHTFTDNELSGVDCGKLLIREKQFEFAVLALTNGKYQYKPMKALCVAIGETLGRRHWTYASICQHFSLYFREMVRSGCAAARHLTFGWGMRFLECLETQGFISPDVNPSATPGQAESNPKFPHMVAAAHITTMAQVCAVVTRYHQPLTQLSYVILPLVLSLYPSSDSRVQQVQSLACHVTSEAPKNSAQHLGMAGGTGGRFGASPTSNVSTPSGSEGSPTSYPGRHLLPPTSLHQVLQTVGPTAVARAKAEKKRVKGGGEAKVALGSLADGDADFDESTLFSLWDRFVVLMVLKQQVSNNSSSALAGVESTASSVGMSSATGSVDSMDSFTSFE